MRVSASSARSNANGRMRVSASGSKTVRSIVLTETNETCGGRLNAQTRILPLTSVDCLLANGFSRLTLQKIVN